MITPPPPNTGSAMDFFTKSSYDLDGGFARMLEQVRTAVGSWYFTDRQERMTIEELNTLAEGLQLSTATAPNGEVFQVVNLGFGGGNSATYFFKNETTKLAPIMVVDGIECFDPGETVEFLSDTKAKRALMRAVRNDHAGPQNPITEINAGVVSHADARMIAHAVREQLADKPRSLVEMKNIVREARYHLGDDIRAKVLLADLKDELDDMVVPSWTEDWSLPDTWDPAYEITSGDVKNVDGKLVIANTRGVSAEDKLMIGRALVPVWRDVFGPRDDDNDNRVDIADNGKIRVGKLTPPGQTQEFTVVDYLDIDDGSFTLFMAPSPNNPDKLVLTTIQFNN